MCMALYTIDATSRPQHAWQPAPYRAAGRPAVRGRHAAHRPRARLAPCGISTANAAGRERMNGADPPG